MGRTLGRLKTMLGGTRTGQAGKRVDGSRQRACAKRVGGRDWSGNTRGFMLHRVYRVPGKFKNAYYAYTDEHAAANLRSCASKGVLPHSDKVVRFDKLGIKSQDGITQYALRKYHGFSDRDIADHKRFGALPYGQYQAMKDIRWMRRGAGRTRYHVAGSQGLVQNTKRGLTYYAGAHAAPAMPHRYNARQGWSRKNKQALRPRQASIANSGPVYDAIKAHVLAGRNGNKNGPRANARANGRDNYASTRALLRQIYA
jgi:hypothetical protein